MDVREKYVTQKVNQKEKSICPNCIHHNLCTAENNQPCFECNRFIDAHGVTMQDNVTELIGRGLDNIYWKIYGANKEFNERMADYDPSSFCAGFQYAIQLAKGLLTQMPQPPKGE